MKLIDEVKGQNFVLKFWSTTEDYVCVLVFYTWYEKAWKFMLFNCIILLLAHVDI